MKNKVFALFTAMLMIVMSFGVSAETDFVRLQDLAEPALLSEEESEKISEMLDEVSEKHGMDIVVLTVDEPTLGLTVQEDATELYEYLGYGSNGIMLYISMTGDWYILTSGFGIYAITDAGIEYISEQFVGYLSSGDFYEAFGTFIEYTDELLIQAENGEPFDIGNMPKAPFNFFMSLVISLAIGFVVSLIITGIWKSKLRSVAFKTRAADYMKQGSLDISVSRDLFLYRTIDRRAKPKQTSGGSTTHRSSSGRTYGGGGGKF